MDLNVAITRRNVKRVRLQMTAAGLQVILPLRYKGEVAEILTKYKHWIARQAVAVQKTQEGLQSLPRYEQSQTSLEQYIARQINEYGVPLGVMPNGVSYRQMKTRWGSCSADRKITFNKKLRYLPEPLIKYVVVHELTHINHLNHSAQFWQQVAQFVPNYKECKQQLKLYGLQLNTK